MEPKVCSRCELEKPVTEYYSDKNKKDGLCTMCKPCKKLGNKNSYLRHRNARLNDVKAYRKANKEKIAEQQKKYYEVNKDKIMERYWENRESKIEYMKQWKKANREHLSKYQQKYYKEREAVDEVFKLRNAISSNIYAAIKRKGCSTAQ